MVKNWPLSDWFDVIIAEIEGIFDIGQNVKGIIQKFPKTVCDIGNM